jgi:hypothetical protein
MTQERAPTDRELEQLKLVCEYIKFHIGLYLATPPVIVLLAQGFKVNDSRWFIGFSALMISAYLVSGISAGWFMGEYVNRPWDDDRLRAFSAEAYSRRRRILHHWLYWVGLGLGFIGIIAGGIDNSLRN